MRSERKFIIYVDYVCLKAVELHTHHIRHVEIKTFAIDNKDILLTRFNGYHDIDKGISSMFIWDVVTNSYPNFNVASRP